MFGSVIEEMVQGYPAYTTSRLSLIKRAASGRVSYPAVKTEVITFEVILKLATSGMFAKGVIVIPQSSLQFPRSPSF